MIPKTYELMGLTDIDVLEIQHFLFPLLADTSDRSTFKVIVYLADKYEGVKLNFAMFLLGRCVQLADYRQAQGLSCYLDPDNLD